MRQLVKSVMVALMVIATCTAAFAQSQGKQSQGKKQRMSREQLAEVQARHIADQLALNDELTSKFVSVFCQQQKEIWALGPRLGRKSATTDEEQIQQRFDRSEKILAIRKKYYKEYSQFLTQAQIKRAYEIERQTMKRFSKKAKRQAQKRQNR